MAFTGWPEAALDFYEGLEIDNSKAYWTAHKSVYTESVLGPDAERSVEAKTTPNPPARARAREEVL